jgi:hypothetical protein
MLTGSVKATIQAFSYDYDDAHLTISDVVRLFSLFTFTREFDTCKKITINLTFSPGNLDSLIDVLHDLQRRHNDHTFDSFTLTELPYVEEHVLQHLTSIIPAVELHFDSDLQVAPAEVPNRLRYLPSSTIRSLVIKLDTSDPTPDEKHFCSWLTTNLPNLEELLISTKDTAVPVAHQGLIVLCYFCAPSLQVLHLDLSTINPLHLRHLLETTHRLKSLTIFARKIQYSSEPTRETLELPELVELYANVLVQLVLIHDLVLTAGDLKELTVRSSLGREEPASSMVLFDAFFKHHWEDHFPDLEVLHYICVKGWGDAPYPFSFSHTGRALTQLSLSFFGYSEHDIWVGGELSTSSSPNCPFRIHFKTGFYYLRSTD